MPAFSANYGIYNVAGSFNQFFVQQLTANGVPGWMPSARVVFDWGVEKPLISGHSGHAFSVNHLSDTEIAHFQGIRLENGSAGVHEQGQVEINMWVSKQSAGNAHMARLRQMRDMVKTLFIQNNWFQITNLYSSTATAPSMTARAVLNDPEFSNPQSDPMNPDLWRIRAVASYWWAERF